MRIPGTVGRQLSSLRPVEATEELGRGGRLRGGAAGELVAAAYAAESAHGPRLARGLSLGRPRARGRARRGRRPRAARMRGRSCAGCSSSHAIPGDEFPWDPVARRRLQRARGRARAARRPLRRRLAERGPAAPRGVPRRRSASPRARAFASSTTRSSTRPRRSPRHARETRDRARDRLHVPPAGAADDRRPPAARLRLPGAPRRRPRARVHAALGASVAGAGGSAGSRWALDRAGSPSSSAARRSSSTRRTPPGRPTSTSSCSRRSRSPRRTRAQLGQDFEIYASQEFGLVELADAHSRASALMPQKKNPYALAAIRTQAGQAAGDLAAALATLHTGSARTDHFHLLNGTVPRALDEAVAIARLTASVLDGIELRPGALRRDRARELRHRRRRRRRARALGRARLPQRAQGGRPRGPRPRRRGRAAVGADARAPRRGGRG